MSHTAKYPPISKPTASLPETRNGLVGYDETSGNLAAVTNGAWGDVSGGAGGGTPTQVFYDDGSMDMVFGDIPIGRFNDGALKPIKGIVLGSSCAVIDRQAFITTRIGKNASNITFDLVFPPNIKEIGLGAFSQLHTDNAQTVSYRFIFNEGLETIGQNAFGSAANATGLLKLPDSLTSLGAGAFGSGFGGSAAIKPTLEIGSGLTEIPSNCFESAGFQGSLTIPPNITTIEGYAFSNCTGFTGTLTIPSNVTTIGNRAFENCSGFTALSIGTGITTIGVGAFQNCTNITNVDCYVEKSVLDVPNSLFDSGVTTIHVRSTDSTWTAGAGQTIGGKTGIEVIKDL